MRILFWIVVVVGGLGCHSNVTPGDFTTDDFLSLDSIIGSQKNLLLGKELVKTVSIDDEIEQASVIMDSSFFQKEWKFLSDFDINKPGYVGGINVIQTDQSLRYEPKTGQSYLLDYLLFSFDRDQQLTAIEGAYVDQQAETIYETTRKFHFKFEEGVIRSYQISGYQKIIMKDTVFFEIQGSVE